MSEHLSNVTTPRDAVVSQFVSTTTHREPGEALGDYIDRLDYQRVPISLISAKAGFNQRIAFPKEEMDDLKDSIRTKGMIQAILIRPRDDGEEGFWLIAGERRWRACTDLDRVDIQSKIAYVSEEEAKVLATVENLRRANLSPAEEAYCARDVLDLCGGDRIAAAHELKWPASTLDARLLLLHCSESVLRAVAEKTIRIGHAELLAGLPHKMQEGVLPRIISEGTSIADLREQVGKLVIPLTNVAFDTRECSGCPFNTATQGSLFGDAVSGANCKNKVCFTGKHNAAIEAQRKSLLDDVAVVALSTEKSPQSYIALTVGGPKGVGAEQFEQCKACANFGALIHATLDKRAGLVERPTCFSMPCHQAKVAARIEAEQQSQNDAEENDAAGQPSGSATTEKGRLSTTKGAKVASGKAKTKTVKTAAPAASTSTALKCMLPAYREAVDKLLNTDATLPLALGVISLQTILNDAGIRAKGVSPVNNKSPEARLAALLKEGDEGIINAFRSATMALVMGGKENPGFSRNSYYPAILAVALAQAKQVDLAPHFRMSTEYLAAHTLEAIRAILVESGFRKWLLEQPDGEKRFRTLSNMKKSDMPAAVMNEAFDWTGFVPRAVTTASPGGFKGL